MSNGQFNLVLFIFIAIVETNVDLVQVTATKGNTHTSNSYSSQSSGDASPSEQLRDPSVGEDRTNDRHYEPGTWTWLTRGQHIRHKRQADKFRYNKTVGPFDRATAFTSATDAPTDLEPTESSSDQVDDRTLPPYLNILRIPNLNSQQVYSPVNRLKRTEDPLKFNFDEKNTTSDTSSDVIQFDPVPRESITVGQRFKLVESTSDPRELASDVESDPFDPDNFMLNYDVNPSGQVDGSKGKQQQQNNNQQQNQNQGHEFIIKSMSNWTGANSLETSAGSRQEPNFDAGFKGGNSESLLPFPYLVKKLTKGHKTAGPGSSSSLEEVRSNDIRQSEEEKGEGQVNYNEDPSSAEKEQEGNKESVQANMDPLDVLSVGNKHSTGKGGKKEGFITTSITSKSSRNYPGQEKTVLFTTHSSREDADSSDLPVNPANLAKGRRKTPSPSPSPSPSSASSSSSSLAKPIAKAQTPPADKPCPCLTQYSSSNQGQKSSLKKHNSHGKETNYLPPSSSLDQQMIHQEQQPEEKEEESPPVMQLTNGQQSPFDPSSEFTSGENEVTDANERGKGHAKSSGTSKNRLVEPPRTGSKRPAKVTASGGLSGGHLVDDGPGNEVTFSDYYDQSTNKGTGTGGGNANEILLELTHDGQVNDVDEDAGAISRSHRSGGGKFSSSITNGVQNVPKYKGARAYGSGKDTYTTYIPSSSPYYFKSLLVSMKPGTVASGSSAKASNYGTNYLVDASPRAVTSVDSVTLRTKTFDSAFKGDSPLRHDSFEEPEIILSTDAFTRRDRLFTHLGHQDWMQEPSIDTNSSPIYYDVIA